MVSTHDYLGIVIIRQSEIQLEYLCMAYDLGIIFIELTYSWGVYHSLSFMKTINRS